MKERITYGGPILEEDKIHAPGAVEEIIYDAAEQQLNKPYSIILPSASVGMFIDRIEAFQHNHTFYRSDGTLDLYSRAILHPESRYSVLRQKLTEIPRDRDIAKVTVSSREVRTIGEAVIDGAEGIDADGYKFFIPIPELQMHKKRTAVFHDFLRGFIEAGGTGLGDVLKRYELYLGSYSEPQITVLDN